MNKLHKILLVAGSALAVGLIVHILPTLANTTPELLPTGDGTYVQWSTSTGSSHSVNVDESTCNGVTDYNYTNTVGNRDSYTLSLASIPDGSTITAIAITPCASKNATTSTSTLDVFYRFGTTNSADMGSYQLTGTSTTPIQLATTTYSGLSHLKGAASTLQIGAVLSSGSAGARLSRVSAIVTFSPLLAPTGLTATTTATSSVSLLWTDNSSNEDGFIVYRGTDGINFSKIGTTGANISSFIDSGLAPGTYVYRVRAYNAAAFSGYTNNATTTVP
jgi:hypothetical protein